MQILSYGLEYRYHVLIGPFQLDLYVLNLNRNSDDCDEEVEGEDLGAGSFGSVRAVKIGSLEFAIKRIYFLSKYED